MKANLLSIAIITVFALPALQAEARRGGHDDRFTQVERTQQTTGKWNPAVNNDRDRSRTRTSKRKPAARTKTVTCRAKDRNGRVYLGQSKGKGRSVANKAAQSAVRTCKRKSRAARTCKFMRSSCRQSRR